jgi:hypothetical protein
MMTTGVVTVEASTLVGSAAPRRENGLFVIRKR